MPYYADLRCSYFKMETNVSWFYEYMSERGMEIEFKPTKNPRYDTEDKVIKDFETFLDMMFEQFITYKVFNHGVDRRIKYHLYDNIFEFVHDQVITYTKEYDGVIIKSTHDTSDDDDE